MHRLPGPYRYVIFAVLCLILNHAQAQLPPIGEWREHLSYHHALSISGVDNSFFVSTPDAVFNVSGPDNTITRYTTINGLHSSGVNAIQSGPSGKLIIGYSNSDVDIISGASVTEVPDLKLSGIPGDKTIHSIYLLGDNAYLSTGLGIIVVSITQYQVQDTYIIGSNGSQVSVYGVATDDGYFYAATTEGLKKASRTGGNLADFSNWELPVGDTLMGSLACQEVVSGSGGVYVLRNDSIYANNGNGWLFRYADGWNISNLQLSGDQLTVSEENPSTFTGRVTLLDTAGSVTRTLEEPGVLVDPRGVFENGGDTWIADAQRGLLNWDGSVFNSLVPNSPDGPLNGQMEDVGSGLWVAGGGLNAGGGSTGDTSGFYRFSGDQWTGYNSVLQPAMKGIRDIVSIAVNSRGDTVYAGSAVGGLARLSLAGTGASPSGTVTISNPGSGSTPNPGSAPGPGSPITGLTYDSTGNLWMINSGASQPLLEKLPDGSILKYALPVNIPGNQLGQVIIDRYNYLWIIAAPGYGALCFNPATKEWKSYQEGTGLGNLPSPYVNCIVCDRQGLVWIGTNDGIAVIECGASIFAGGCDATLPVVQQDAFAGYLFQGQEVLSIAVDGADRKWVGTTTGAWLISEDGEQVITNLTTQNSPLFNDTINVTGIDGATGEVFFSTPGGMCSFRSTATVATRNAGNLLVFPNPVPPGYSGTIGIRGVPDNAIVKITEMNGRLVYQTQALGGQAVWNGNDYTGRRVASGVYLVLIADQNNQEKAVTKIVFIH
jgi:hypothetical protein